MSSEPSTQSPGKNASVSTSGLLISCLALLGSSLMSHPIFSYAVNFLSFLCPLFVTTFLVLLALLTLSPGLSQEQPSKSKLGSLFGVCSSVVSRFRANAAEESEGCEVSQELEVYKIIFEASDLESGQDRPKGEDSGEESEPLVDKFLIYGDDSVHTSDALFSRRTEENPEEITHPDVESGKKLGALLQEEVGCEMESLEIEEGEAKAKVKAEGEDSEKVDEGKQGDNSKSASLLTKESEAKCNDNDERNNNIFIRRRQSSRRFGESSLRIYENGGGDQSCEKMGLGYGSFGSMRREKEWKRTLACKLFEERHNVEGEGMDSLWETYESNDKEAKRKCSKKGKKETVFKRVDSGYGGGDCEEEDEDEEEDEMDEKFCCLQALKLSAGKMNLGMGRPNLVRISRAFRGIGWLHHVTKHGKKA